MIAAEGWTARFDGEPATPTVVAWDESGYALIVDVTAGRLVRAADRAGFSSVEPAANQPAGSVGAAANRVNGRTSRAAQQKAWGRWLRTAREDADLGLREFARALEIAPTQVCNYESGKSKVPDERATAIARVLELDEITVRRSLGLWVPE